MNLSKKDRKLEVYLKDPQNIENQKEIVQKIFPNDLCIVGLILTVLYSQL